MKIVGMRAQIQGIENGFLYIDASVKFFTDDQDALDYQNYLGFSTKYPEGYFVFSQDVTIVAPGGIDIAELQRQDALAKLTEADKQALGL